jgi:hypothetical protein
MLGKHESLSKPGLVMRNRFWLYYIERIDCDYFVQYRNFMIYNINR